MERLILWERVPTAARQEACRIFSELYLRQEKCAGHWGYPQQAEESARPAFHRHRVHS